MIGIIGGTGPEGRGLALRLALAGRRTLLGSRSASRAAEAAASVLASAPGAQVEGVANDEAARRCESAIIAIPYEAQATTLAELRQALAGKMALTTVVPMRVDRTGASYAPPPEGSAAMQTQALLPDSRVVAAFQTVSAHDLLAAPQALDSDVIVCSDWDDCRREVMALADAMPGARGIDGGPLRNAALVESVTPLLLNINRAYRTRAAIRLTGV